jgi:3-oxoacyl-[acyl-carrier-protein] synthase II
VIRVVVTGMGMVTAAGTSVDACWETLLRGESRVRRVTLWDPTGMASHIAAEVPEMPEVPARIGPYEIGGRPLSYALSSVLEALAQAGIDDSCDVPPNRRVVVAAGGFDDLMLEFLAAAADGVTESGESSFEGLDAEELAQRFDDPSITERMDRYSQVVLMQAVAHAVGARQAFTVSTACAGGSQAIGDALGLLRRGEADLAVAVGVDTLVTREMMGGFCNLTALSTRNDEPERASRPFDKDRDGFVMGEGAAALVLEREDMALARGATILAELAGIGYSGDAHSLTAPHPSGHGMALSMQRALDDAGIGPESVDYVNAHGTSTAANDKAETAAIRQVLGAHADRVVLSGTKSMIGHLVHGAGAVGAVVAVKSILEQRVHPTANYETPDPDCDLDYTPGGPRALDIDAVLVNAFGFGGQNAGLVLRRYREGAA